MNDLELKSHIREIQEAVHYTRQVAGSAPSPTHDEFIRLIAAQAVIFQQASMALLMESRIVVGQKQVTRLQLACTLATEANKAFKLVLPHLKKEKLIEMGASSVDELPET